MATTTTADKPVTETKKQKGTPVWQTILFWLAIIALVLVAFNLRLYELGLPFDRDGYDEGVYWQTLRAMSGGHPLYAQIFYSQPPFFMLSVYPVFAFFGGTLWSARCCAGFVARAAGRISARQGAQRARWCASSAAARCH